MTRIFICGCVQALCDMAPLSSLTQIFNQEAARAEDVRAATSIAMCAQYAQKDQPDPAGGSSAPADASPDQLWGVAQVRERELMLRMTGNDTPATNTECAHATSMKLWCVRVSQGHLEQVERCLNWSSGPGRENREPVGRTAALRMTGPSLASILAPFGSGREIGHNGLNFHVCVCVCVCSTTCLVRDGRVEKG